MSIAIIGMGARFPGINNVHDFWEKICSGEELISFFDNSALDPALAAYGERPGYVKARGFIREADGFDCGFFGMSPAEASLLDPQHRIFIETCWHALEDAGCNPDNYNGLIGVFGGTGTNTYYQNNILRNPKIMETFGDHTLHLANGADYLTTRVSYLMNLRGPSIGVYTGCSLSLVAVCLSCSALMNYETDIALAGGSYIHCPLQSGYFYQEGEIYSKDGHCRPFDAGATGTVFSNGCGITVLKRLDDAVKDGDRIYAVIKGWALNNDGSKKVSFTAPGIDGQMDVVTNALALADMEADTIGYIETHGTGTPVGDPIEMAALTKVYTKKKFTRKGCAIGSVKANIGHLDAAAGVAGLMKSALVVYHKKIPPHINFSTLNPSITLDDSPFYIPQSLTDWPAAKKPCRAAVTSLGVGGTNAHSVLEEAVQAPGSGTGKGWHIIPYSAKTQTALDIMIKNFISLTGQPSVPGIADVAFTLQNGRRHFTHRCFTVVKDCADLGTVLSDTTGLRIISGKLKTPCKEVVFMYSGQGSQYPGMLHGLYDAEPVFRDNVDRCTNIIKKIAGFDIRDFMYPNQENGGNATENLAKTSITQPALFTIEYALHQLWLSWGISPCILTGHSIGEYTAACCAGVFSLEDACYLVTERGRLMESMPPGSMLAVPLDEHELENLCRDGLSLATLNGPRMGVVAGTTDAIHSLKSRLEATGIQSTIIKTSHAFHSSMMDPILEPFEKIIASVHRSPPRIPFISNVTGIPITDGDATDPSYWSRHLRGTVRFNDCLSTIFEKNHRICLEVGPGKALFTFAAGHPGKKDSVVIASARHPREDKNDCVVAFESLGRMWLSGFDVTWGLLYKDEQRKKVTLPLYPFERKRCWIDPVTGQQQPGNESGTGIPRETNLFTPSETTEQVMHYIHKKSVEDELGAIWKELLGVDQVPSDATFFDLGGSSLVAASLFSRIEQQFRKKLPLATLYSAPTIRQLAQIIQKDGESNEDAWSPLVTIKKGDTTAPPLFLIHGAGGNVLLYHALSNHFPAAMPVYGLQSQGLDGSMPILTSIEAMASRYLEEIIRVCPNGPYFIGGYCLGGSIALEIAQQLMEKGVNVKLLFFFETYDFSQIGTVSRKKSLQIALQKVDFHFRNFIQLQQHEKMIFIKEKYLVAKSRLPMVLTKVKTTVFRKNIATEKKYSLLNDIWQSNDQAAYRYVPRKYPGNVVQFLPAREYIHHQGSALSMQKIGAGQFISETLPIYPAGMLIEPLVKILAEKIITYMNDAMEGNVGNT